MMLFVPELFALLATLAVFVGSITPIGSAARSRLAIGCSALVLGAAVWGLSLDGEPFFSGIYRVDAFSQLLKVGIALGTFLVLLGGGDFASVRPNARADVPFFVFASAAGMMMLVSATEALTFYVCLELSAYGLFVLAALHADVQKGSEAGMRYLVYGAAASAVTLYGISLLFGLSGSTYFDDMTRAAASSGPLFVAAVLLVLSGLFFKLAVFPFQAWAPDVYEASAHPVAAFVGTVSKVAAAGVLIRICVIAAPAHGELDTVFFVLAVVSMTAGNLAALAQTDLKRLLGYSTIAHAGYLLVGLYAFSEVGFASVMFYAVAYVVMAFGAFWVVGVVGHAGDNPSLRSLNGLWKRSPLAAGMLLVAMFGLAGIPPTPGFAGKWFLFAAALEQGQFVLVLIAAANAAISLYYYLIVVKHAWLDPEGDDELAPLAISPRARLAAGLTFVGVALLGILPAPLWDLATEAARAALR